MSKTPKAANPTADKPDPSEVEKKAIRKAIDRVNARPRRVCISGKDGKMQSPHADHDGWTNRLADTLGTTSDGFMSAALASLDYTGRGRGSERLSEPQGVNAALALVAAINPADELEAALAIQMAGTHALSTELLGRAKQTDRTDHIQLYAGLAVKLQNTFAAQITALAKLRGGGKQQVEVRHVYINGNAVIGDVHATGGEAGAAFGHRPHVQGLEHLPGAPCPPMRSADPGGECVPVAGDGGPDEMPDARRS